MPLISGFVFVIKLKCNCHTFSVRKKGIDSYNVFYIKGNTPPTKQCLVGCSYYLKEMFFIKRTRHKLLSLFTLQISMVLMLGLFLVFEYNTRTVVALTIDGKEEVVQTHAQTVGELLEEQSVDVTKNDDVSHSVDAKIKDNMEIEVKKANTITIIVNDKEKQVQSTADTIEEFLKEQAMTVHEYDIVTPGLSTKIKGDTEITIKYAKKVNVVAAEKTTSVWTQKENVKEVLKEQAIAFDEDDVIYPSLTKSIKSGMTIKVTKVEGKTETVKEVTDFSVVRKNDASLSKGKEKVVQQGVKGEITKQYKVTYENGKEVKRDLVKTETTKQAVNKVIHVGTKVYAPAPSTSKNTSTKTYSNASSSKELYVTATAYTAECRGCSGTTATGVNLKANPNAKVIAVDPSIIPLGTKVWVEGYGYAVAADTGGAIKGNKIDLYMSSENQANKFGRRTVKIKVLN